VTPDETPRNTPDPDSESEPELAPDVRLFDLEQALVEPAKDKDKIRTEINTRLQTVDQPWDGA
jgi:hypothetical protein